MPVVAIPLDELSARLGRTLPPAELEHALHRFGCSVEGWGAVERWRCPACGAVVESGEDEKLPPPTCDGCGAALRDAEPPAESLGRVDVLKMELLAVRPDLFDAAGLARGLAGFLGFATGSPALRVEAGTFFVDVDPALAGPDVNRPRIAAATVHGLALDEGRLRSLMKLQDNIHWALGRDRKHASIGVYNLATINGPGMRYRAVDLHGVRFVPLGFDPRDPQAALDPAAILERHPKGRAYARLLAGFRKAPLLEDAHGRVLSMPPIINSEATRVTTGTRDVFIDVTGTADRHVDRALNIIVASLLDGNDGAVARTVEIRYADGSRTTPDFSPQDMTLDPREAARIVGVALSAAEIVELLRRMRHEARVDGAQIRVSAPAWRADILHARDLVEDVAIAYGYDCLPAAALESATYGQAHPREERAALARAALIGQGFLEVMTLVLSSEEATVARCALTDEAARAVQIENPVSVEQTMVRTSLIPGLLETLAINLGHSYPQRIFEVGVVAAADPGAPTGAREFLRAALAVAGDGEGYASGRAALDALLAELGAAAGVSFAPSTMSVFLPGRGADLLREGQWIGRLGEVHPAVLERHRIVHPVVIAEVDLGL